MGYQTGEFLFFCPFPIQNERLNVGFLWVLEDSKRCKMVLIIRILKYEMLVFNSHNPGKSSGARIDELLLRKVNFSKCSPTLNCAV